MSGLSDRIGQLIGKHKILSDAQAFSAYFDGEVLEAKAVAVLPASTEEVQEVVRFAGKEKVPVYTSFGYPLPARVAGSDGIIINFKKQNKIEKIDRRNLIVHVQRGVSFEQINQDLKPHGMRVFTPVAARSESVAECLVHRNVLKAAGKFAEVQVLNLRVVLADGQIHKTGTHSISEDGVDYKEDAGPSLSKWYNGSEDTFGIFTRASLMCYPNMERRLVRCYSFGRYEDLVKVMRDACRREVGQEYIGCNARYLRGLLGKGNFPLYLLIVGFEAYAELADYEEEWADRYVKKEGGKEAREWEGELLNRIDLPWRPASPNQVAYYSAYRNNSRLRAAAYSGLKEAKFRDSEVGECLVSICRGRNCYSIFDLFPEGGQVDAQKISLKLAKAGAFFDLPRGELAREIYKSIPGYRRHLRRIKQLMDPEGILNPQVDYLFDPQAQIKTQFEIPTLTTDTLTEAVGVLKKALGDEWVSDHPVDLSSYARDFTVTPGQRPDIVALPKNTADIQAIMEVAYEYGLPVVPLSTGFNHGGLTLPRHGGILVDLRRMTRLLEIDPDSMTAVVEPHVRMRALWMDARKHETDDFTLKPILPMTFGSISILANYVSRGGAGSAVKYGPNAELIVDMKFVLPNGEILNIGPNAVPGVEGIALQYGPGPEIAGMFLNADGAFGICTEMRVKLFPDFKSERILGGASFVDDYTDCVNSCNAIYDLSQLNFCEFLYKFHHGVLAAGTAGLVGANPYDLVQMVPKHFLLSLFSGLDEKQVEIKAKKLEQIMEKHGMTMIDPMTLGMAELTTNDPMKRSLGTRGNKVTAFQGAFQWLACYIKVEKVPEMDQQYKQLIAKYWKPADPKFTIEMAMSGCDIQGPMPFARGGTCEFDWWWDHGNPDSIKRATKIIRKAAELQLDHGGLFIRNMHDLGEMQLSRWGVYTDIYKKVRKMMDPADLMHPGVIDFKTMFPVK
ncbi:MAG: FAD-binding oxidoreductase [Proteobacteria bacterium]|nr:FAD-binding oxidoreductase [Pseudomonadota bacterium]